MLVGRHTTAQSAKIQSFGVHLSVGKEWVRIPRRNTLEKKFLRYGAAHGRAQGPNPWFRSRILGEKRAQEPTPGSAVEHCRFLDTGGGGGGVPLTLAAGRTIQLTADVHSHITLRALLIGGCKMA